jgi:hypothetical protein
MTEIRSLPRASISTPGNCLGRTDSTTTSEWRARSALSFVQRAPRTEPSAGEMREVANAISEYGLTSNFWAIHYGSQSVTAIDSFRSIADSVA